MINQTYNGTERGEYVHKKDFEAITIISPDYENQRFKIGESAFAHSNSSAKQSGFGKLI